MEFEDFGHPGCTPWLQAIRRGVFHPGPQCQITPGMPCMVMNVNDDLLGCALIPATSVLEHGVALNDLLSFMVTAQGQETALTKFKWVNLKKHESLFVPLGTLAVPCYVAPTETNVTAWVRFVHWPVVFKNMMADVEPAMVNALQALNMGHLRGKETAHWQAKKTVLERLMKPIAPPAASPEETPAQAEAAKAAEEAAKEAEED